MITANALIHMMMVLVSPADGLDDRHRCTPYIRTDPARTNADVHGDAGDLQRGALARRLLLHDTDHSRLGGVERSYQTRSFSS